MPKLLLRDFWLSSETHKRPGVFVVTASRLGHQHLLKQSILIGFDHLFYIKKTYNAALGEATPFIPVCNLSVCAMLIQSILLGQFSSLTDASVSVVVGVCTQEPEL